MAASHDEFLKQEPLFNNAQYEKIANLPPSAAGAAPTLVARRRATGEYVSIKFIPRGYDPDTTARLIRSTINHMELSTSLHPHIVVYKETFLTPHYLAMVTEYIEGETIEHFLEKIGGKVIEGLAKFVFQQMIIAIDYCHQRGKLLRDIKLCNILLSMSEGQLPLLKLCDFMSSKDLARDLDSHPQDSSILYAAPEVLQNLNGGMYDGKTADLWACGIILYIMLFGRHPFLRDQDSVLSQDQRMVTMLQRTIRGDAEYPWDVASTLSPACVDILHRMIQVQPSQRLNMQQLMQHPWFLEALPEGAGTMNHIFLRDSRSLGASDIASIQAIMHKGSTVEGDAAALSLHAQLMQVNLGQQQPPAMSVAGPSSSQHQHQQQMGGQAASPASDSLCSSVATPQQQQQGVSTPPYLIQQLVPGHGGPAGSPGHLPDSYHSPGPGAQSAPELGGLHQNFAAQDSLHRGLLELEENLMSLPSVQLKTAAIEDILRAGAAGRCDSLPSPVAGRTMSELERGLMASASFMREFMNSGVGMAALLGDAAPLPDGAAPPPADGGHIVDASPFLYDSPTADHGMPHASFSAMRTSFDFRSFNKLFSLDRSSDASVAAMPQLPPLLDSPWARICRDASIKRV